MKSSKEILEKLKELNDKYPYNMDVRNDYNKLNSNPDHTLKMADKYSL
jgi:hypothetical protein